VALTRVLTRGGALLGNLNGWELIALAMLALFIFGPERLPKVVGDAMRMLRGLRTMARNATQDLSRELGTDVSLEDLHPKTFIRKHILSDEDQKVLRQPLDDLARDVRGLESDVRRTVRAEDPTETKPADGPGQHRADPDAT
jgi:sec-independent protein translocase protein TatB